MTVKQGPARPNAHPLDNPLHVYGQRQRKITAATALTKEDFGWLILVNGVASVTVTLPPPTADAMIEIYNMAGQNLLITSPVAATLVGFNNAAATTATFNTAGQLIGAGAVLVSDGVNWYLMPFGPNTVALA